MTEREKMLAGKWYNAQDDELQALRRRSRLLMARLNVSADDAIEERLDAMSQLLPKAGKGLWIEPPFYCDYGVNIILGDNVFSILTASCWMWRMRRLVTTSCLALTFSFTPPRTR